MGSYVWDTGTFGLFTCLAVCNLEQFGQMCPDFQQKWQTHAGLSCTLSLGGLEVLGLHSLRSTLIFLRGVTSTNLTISLTEGSEEKTKFVEWFLGPEMLSSKPKLVLFKGDFWILNMCSSLELVNLLFVLKQ